MILLSMTTNLRDIGKSRKQEINRDLSLQWNKIWARKLKNIRMDRSPSMSSRDPSPGTIFRLQVPFLRLSEELRLVNQSLSWTLAKRSLSRSSHRKVSTRTSIACHLLIAKAPMHSTQPARKWCNNLRANTSRDLGMALSWLLSKTKSVLLKRDTWALTTSQEKASRERSMWMPWFQILAISSIKAKKSRGQAPPTTGTPVTGTRSCRVLVRHQLPFPQ